jgi:hypothetical protein
MMTGGRSLLPSRPLPLPPCRVHVPAPDGEHVACVANDQLSLWPLDGPAPVWSVSASPRAVSFADQTLVSLGYDRSLSFHDLHDGAAVASWTNIFCTDRLDTYGDLAVTTGPACMRWHHGAHGEHGHIDLCKGGILLALAVSPSRDTWVASCSDGPWQTGEFSVPYTNTAPSVPAPPLPSLALALRFAAPDRLIAGLADGSVALLAWPSLEVLATRETGLAKVDGLALSGSGRTVLVRAAASAPTLLDTAELLVLGTAPGLPMRPAGFIGERLFVTTPGELLAFDIPEGLPRWLDGPDGVVDLAVSPTGDTLAVVRLQGAELRDVATGALIARTGDGARHLKGGVFSAGGEAWLEISSNQPLLHRHGQRGAEAPGQLAMPFVLKRIASLPGDDVLTLDYYGQLRRHPADALGTPLEVPLPGLHPGDVAADAVSGHIATLDGASHAIHLLDPASLAPHLLGADRDAFALAIAPGGGAVATGGRRGVRVLERGPAPVMSFDTGDQVVIELAFSPDGCLLAAGTLDGDCPRAPPRAPGARLGHRVQPGRRAPLHRELGREGDGLLDRAARRGRGRGPVRASQPGVKGRREAGRLPTRRWSSGGPCRRARGSPASGSAR